MSFIICYRRSLLKGYLQKRFINGRKTKNEGTWCSLFYIAILKGKMSILRTWSYKDSKRVLVLRGIATFLLTVINIYYLPPAVFIMAKNSLDSISLQYYPYF